MPYGQATNKGRRFPVEVLTSEEVRAMMAVAARREGYCGVRDRALIATLYRGGLRITEALELMPKDLDTATGTVQVLRGKGGKARVVGLDPEAVALVELWLEKRAELGLNGRHPIFCTLSGGPMKPEQARTHLKELARKAGIEKRVHPHGLRHSRAVNLLERGVDVKTIQMALGHSNIGTTDTYLSHLSPAKVLAAMREATW